MATRIGLYYKTGGVESGGTNALTGLLSGGTMISQNDESAPFVFPEMDTVYTLYYKTEDGTTYENAGEETTTVFTVSCPTGVQACKTWDGTFASAPNDIPVATGAFQPLYVKQTALQDTASANIEVGTNGVTFQYWGALTESFASSLDTERWSTVTPANTSAEVASGKLKLLDSNTSGAVGVFAFDNIPLAYQRDWSIDALVDASETAASGETYSWGAAIVREATVPTSDTNYILMMYLRCVYSSGDNNVRFAYYNGTAIVYWDFTNTTWTTTFNVTTCQRTLSAEGTQYHYCIDADATDGIQMTVWNAEKDTIAQQSGTIAWSSFGRTGNFWFAASCSHSSATRTTNQLQIDSYTRAG